MSTDFKPRWASPPGATIRDVLGERDHSDEDLASLLDIPSAQAARLLNGSERITVRIAQKLSEVFGGSPPFWMARDSGYLDDLDRVAADDWAGTLPIADMVAYGWIERPETWVDRLDSALGFFEVSNVAEWEGRYATEVARFRTTAAEVPVPKVSAWLRAAALAAHDVGPWEPEQFKMALGEIRKLTVQRDPSSFIPELQRLASESGVVVTVLRAPRGCRVSGAARLLEGGSRQVVLSARHLADDHFWFTFFHEAAHVLLHRLDDGYIDEVETDGVAASTKDEVEADNFAAESLVPRSLLDELQWKRWPTPREVITLSRRAGVSPGVVVGQLQHHGRLGYATKLNGLKRRYQWNGVSLERA